MGAATELLGREVGLQGERRTYVVTGDADEAAALATLAAAAPPYVNGMRRNDVRVADIGGGLYQGTVEYGEAGSAGGEAGEAELVLDIASEIVHITQSLETVYSEAVAPWALPDHGGLIGVSADRTSVEGCDVWRPRVSYGESYISATLDAAGSLSLSSGEFSFVQAVYQTVGKTNDAAWKGFAAGECLFVGARISKKRNGDWSRSFQFLVSENVAALPVGPLTVPKRGWEYVWVDKIQIDVGGNVQVGQRAVFVERVYDSADFGALGIGS